MPTWVSGYERLPYTNGTYFVKSNGYKCLLRQDEMQRKMDLSETFHWLDESDNSEMIKKELIGVKTIEDFIKIGRHDVSREFLTPYTPYINKSIKTNFLHKYYLTIIAQLRKEIGSLKRGISTNPENKKIKVEFIQEKDELLERIRELNNSPYF